MEELIGIIVPIAFLAFGLTIFGGIGKLRENRHLHALEEAEQHLANMVVTDLKTLPPGAAGGGGHLVMGEVVIANDYLKAFLARIRNVFGGEMRSYQTLLNRARREARLRMLQQAASLGATTVINVRFDTSQIGNSTNQQAMPTTEVLCYGTAVLPPRS